MKFLETHFIDYTNEVDRYSLHPSMEKWYQCFPDELTNLKNLIYYGPAGVGKYSQVLHSIQKYSPSQLRYNKKINVVHDKGQLFFKMSDIHFEIDFSLLGCNSKLLWHDIYLQIVDVLSTRPNKCGIIVCKQFHHIHVELLDIFYTYMQQNQPSSVHIVFILLTEHVSFIPNSILNACEILHFQRPFKTAYAQCIQQSVKTITDGHISNIKHLKIQLNFSQRILFDKILKCMIQYNSLGFVEFRDMLYDLFIFNVNLGDGIWYILNELKLTNDSNVLIRTFVFFKYYQNNYRPIYHLEGYLLYLINVYHGFAKSS
jgi:hypothetical protein